MSDFNDKATVSGSVVSIENGADEVGAKSCVVTIPASLSGVSSVTEKQTGRNLIKPDKYQASATQLMLGQTNNNDFETFLKAGTYTISYSTTGEPCYIYRREQNDASNTNLGKATSKTFTINEDGNFRFWLYGDGAVSANVSNVQLETGSTVHTYEPYQTPTQYTASLGRTIYGGEVDIVNGTGEETFGYIVFDGSENWGTYPSYNGYYIGISDMESGTRQDGLCNQLTCSKSNAQGQTNAFWLGVGNKNLYIIGVYDSMGNTLEAFKDYLAEHPLILVYPLDTPTDFTFTGQTIETKLGTNNFWSEQGDTELTYYKSGYGYTSVTVHKETPDCEPVEQTAKLHKVIYAGEVDVIKGTAKPKNLMTYPYATESGSTSKNIEFTFDDKGIIHLEGEHSTTGNAVFYLDNNVNLKNLASGKYVFSQDGFNFTASSDTVQLTVVNKSDDSVSKRIQLNGSTTSKSFVVGDDEYIHDVFIRISPHSVNIDVNVMLESGETETTFAPYFEPFTFPPISMETDEGENTLFANEGDSAIIYRKQAE